MNVLSEWFSDSALVSATWIDWLDILVLAWVYYRGLLFLRGTRALQSLIGLGLLAVVYLVSDIVELSTIHWLLDRLFVWVALALVILFQEDIRRALAGAGGTLFGRTTRASDTRVIEEMIKACFALAGRRIGALVALERTANLAPYADGAHRLDAMVTTELLQSIFHPSSPIHDGAVLVRDGRVMAAGVFLPISLTKDISRAYGTRHRAAVGLTEATDAICLVVSEERGTVSLVTGGEVVPVADPNDLRQRLQETFERTVAAAEGTATPAASGQEIG